MELAGATIYQQASASRIDLLVLGMKDSVTKTSNVNLDIF
jgi:hypothetical protein